MPKGFEGLLTVICQSTRPDLDKPTPINQGILTNEVIFSPLLVN